MTALLATPLGRAIIRAIIGLIGAIVLIAILVFGFKAWLSAHDRNVLSGYVALSEKAATDAQLAEMTRQRDAASQALSDAQKRKDADERALKVANDNLEKIIAADTATDGCTWSPADLDWLRAHGSKAR